MLHKSFNYLARLAALLCVASPVAGQAPCDAVRPASHGKNAPITVDAITPCDLKQRVKILSDDSMRGRLFGTDDDARAARYIVSELTRLGLTPAGEHGTFLQHIPLFVRRLDSTSTIQVGGRTFHAGVDFVVTAVGQLDELGPMNVVFGGAIADTANLLTSVASSSIVLMTPSPAVTPPLAQSAAYKAYQKSLTGATIATVIGERIPEATIRSYLQPSIPGALRQATAYGANHPSPLSALYMTRPMAEAILGTPLSQATKGMKGATITAHIRFRDSVVTSSNNIVAIIPGRDKSLKNQYVALSARLDHLGTAARPVDHDSLRAYNSLARPGGIDGLIHPLTPPDWTAIRQMIDSLHREHGGARADSIFNGADAVSGSAALLEIAETLRVGKGGLPRSVLFVWHDGEERGLWGSQYFSDYPTVPRDSIVAMIMLDQIGRRDANALAVLGAGRVSSQFAAFINNQFRADASRIPVDSSFDSAGDVRNTFCKSSVAMYSGWGIPSLQLGGSPNVDRRTVADEAQYLDYEWLRHVTDFASATTLALARMPRMFQLDHPKPVDNRAGCRQ